MRSRCNVILVLALAAVFALGAASARAATTIGVATANMTKAGFNICAPSIECTYFQRNEMTSGPAFTAPTDGVIVRWRLGSGSLGSKERLRVIRPAGAGSFVGAGSSDQVTSSGTQVDTFNTRLPIKAGDGIGVDNDSSALLFTRPFLLGNDVGRFSPFLPDGGSPSAITGDTSVDVLQLNADIEPDTDNDGFGDETQDACPGATGSINGCPKADLELAQSAARGSQNDLVTYRLVATNTGPDPVPDAVVADTLPAGASVVSASGPGGACPGAAGGKVTCGAGALAAGTSATVTIATRLKAGTATNVATATSAALAEAVTKAAGAGDTNPANNATSSTLSVVGPALGSAKLSSSRICLRRKTCKPANISFNLSEPATVKLTFARLRTGRKVHARCLKQTRSNGHKPHCTRKSPAGSLPIAGRGGANKLTFAGRLSSHKSLKPGRYSLTISAIDSAGNSSTQTSRTIRVVR